MPLPAHAQLNATIAAFAADITRILTRAADDAVRGALPKAGRRTKGAHRPPPSRRATGRKVSAEELFAEVRKKADLRMEELAKRLGTSTGALKAPMTELLEGKKVKRSGQARGTKYRAA